MEKGHEIWNLNIRCHCREDAIKSVVRRPGQRWQDNIKMGLRETGIGGASWVRLAQGRVQWQAFVSTVMNLRVP
jgi:hypothetical protein